MRKSNQEIKSPDILEEILAGSVICRLALLDGDRPCIIPVNYGYRAGCIHIHSAPEGRKIKLLKENNQVCFEIEDTVKITKGDQACDWTTRYRSVVGYGTVEIISSDQGKQQGLEVIMAQHGAPDLVGFNLKNLKRMVILKLTITSMTGKQSSNWNPNKED